jgi:hypothetical protein
MLYEAVVVLFKMMLCDAVSVLSDFTVLCDAITVLCDASRCSLRWCCVMLSERQTKGKHESATV